MVAVRRCRVLNIELDNAFELLGHNNLFKINPAAKGRSISSYLIPRKKPLTLRLRRVESGLVRSDQS